MIPKTFKTITIIALTTLAALIASGKTKPDPDISRGRCEICIQKFDDKNGNGVRDAGEAGIPGWSFTIMPGGRVVTTGANGGICFPANAPGTYTFTEQTRSGWVPTGPLVKSLTVIPNKAYTVTFGNKRGRRLPPESR